MSNLNTLLLAGICLFLAPSCAPQKAPLLSQTHSRNQNTVNASDQASTSAAPVSQITDAANTSVLFEDNFLYGSVSSSSYVYRIEGDANAIQRVPSGAGGRLNFNGGFVSMIHPALCDDVAVQVQLQILQGTPVIAIAHNGLNTNTGAKNSSPGIAIKLGAASTSVVDLASGSEIQNIPEVVARKQSVTVRVAWNMLTRKLRVDLPEKSYNLILPASVTARAGFAIQSNPGESSQFSVSKIKVIHEDTRPLVFYDLVNTMYDSSGHALGTIAPVKMPIGKSHYLTLSIDMIREKSLIVLGGSNLTWGATAAVQAYAIRDLKTGALTLLASAPNGCIPGWGGGSMDGIWLVGSFGGLPSTCWIDWGAYARGNMAGMFKVDHASYGTLTSTPRLSFTDPTNGLDGSVARYLRLDQSMVGRNYITVHPELKRFVSSSLVNDQPLPLANTYLSQTGPGGWMTTLAVRDKDRMMIEHWNYASTNIHAQNLGFNLFTQTFDWVGTLHNSMPSGAAYMAYVNESPNFLIPGNTYTQDYQFIPSGGSNYDAKVKFQNFSQGSFVTNPALGTTDFVATNSVPLNPVQMYYGGVYSNVSSALAAGNYEDSKGTVWWVDGAGGACYYPSEGDLLESNGKNSWGETGITNLGKDLPSSLQSTGACTYNLGTGNYSLSNSAGLYYSNGGGHVCLYASWASWLAHGGPADWKSVTKIISKLPSETVVDGTCYGDSALLTAGIYNLTTTGTLYYSDGAGHVCYYPSWDSWIAHGGSTNWKATTTAISSLPTGTTVDGACSTPAATPAPPPPPPAPTSAAPLPVGNFYPSNIGGLYYSNGAGAVCLYGSWQSWLAHGGTANWTTVTTIIPALPPGMKIDGVCK